MKADVVGEWIKIGVEGEVEIGDEGRDAEDAMIEARKNEEID